MIMESVENFIPNIRLAFIPIYYLSNLFGVMPLEYRGNYFNIQNQSPCRFHLSKRKFCFALFCLLISFIHTLLAPFYVIRTYLPNNCKRGRILTKFHNESSTLNNVLTECLIIKIVSPLLVGVMSFCIRIISVTNLRKELEEFFVKVNQVDKYMQMMNCFKPGARTFEHFLHSFGICLTFVVFCLPLHIHYLRTPAVSYFNKYFVDIWRFLYVWSSLTGYCGDILFIYCAYLIRLRFSRINETLKLHNSQNNCKHNKRKGQMEKIRLELPVLGRTKLEHQNQINKVLENFYEFRVRKEGRNHLLEDGGIFPRMADAIEVHRFCHRSLCSLLKQLNDIFKLQLLITLSSCFLFVLFFFYFSIFGFATAIKAREQDNSKSEMLISICWNIHYFSRFVLLTGVAHCTANQGAYGLGLIFSLFCLSLMSLFDIYYELYGYVGENEIRPSLATYVWLLQYLVRFVMIVEISQKMTDEGLRTKTLVSNLNNRFLDSDTKEELALFMNHISNNKIEFTACDFFTLNTRLITSAIAAGTTYLVILVQFHTDKE